MIINNIKNILKEGVLKKHFPGVHFGYVEKNQIPKSDYVGYKQLYPSEVKLKGDEIYDVASLTKVVSTTTLIMKLIEESKLTLDTKVNEIIDWYPISETNVYDLLTHSSGLPADIPRANTLRDREDVENKIKSVKLKVNKDEYIIYSDIGFILLGFMIEKITGKTLHEYSQEIIFKPLGMKDTSYQPNGYRCAPTEFRDDEVYKGFLKGLVHDEKAFAIGGAGHAGLFSTVNDLNIFIKSILENRFVLKKENVDLLFKVQNELPSLNGNILKRALGWDKPTKGGSSSDMSDFDQTILHTGFTGCNMFIDRKHEIGFVMLSNAVHPKRELNEIIGYRKHIAQKIYEYREENKHA
jgi:CubicO group peptidase (beta-lactamase class C family)